MEHDESTFLVNPT